MKKRILSFLLATLMLGGFVACTTPTPPPDGESTPSATPPTTPPADGETTEPDTKPPFDWGAWEPAAGADMTELSVPQTKPREEVKEQIISYAYTTNDPSFTLKNAEVVDDTTVKLLQSTVSAIVLNAMFEDGSVATYSFKIRIEGGSSGSAWNTQYIGLRLAGAGSDATNKNGIWIALRNQEIGIRTGAWAETTYMSLKDQPVDFRAEQSLVVEDDMSTDTVTVSVLNGSGDKVAIAVVKVEGDTVSMYRPGEDTPAITDKGVTVPATGYFNIWLHHLKNGDSFVSDLKAEGKKAVKQTYPEANGMNSVDILPDTWVAVDDEGRVSGYDPKAATDKKVGIFYFLWHTTSNQPIYDHAKAFAEGGAQKLIEVMQQGPLGFAHYWAEPYFGYYQSNDEWVIRKHTMQLTAAGVDFIFIDATNGRSHEPYYEVILKVWSEMRAEGYDTPRIAFHCGNNDDLARASVTEVWNNLYSVGRYRDFWFLYNGKPLIFMPMSLHATLPEEMQEFFTYRQSWAYTKSPWYTETHGRNCWPWADMYPQRGGLSPEGKLEQMIVMCGFWANGSYGTNAGRSYSYLGGGQPAGLGLEDFSFSLVDKTSGKGIAFEEQFEHAIGKDPGLIMIIGWNEWWAGRWEANAAVGQTIANTYKVTNDNEWTRHYFVDAFSPEHSRDIEPVKGYFNDNYYYQMVQNIRQYKGSRAPLAAFGQRPIDMAGVQSQWDMVGPEYRDYTGDTAHRDHDSFVGQLHYTNTTGRNDLGLAKVTRFGDEVWFYVECAADITAPEGESWMNLYVNADCKQETGWYGYDYIINRDRDGETCSVQRFADGKWEMTEVGRAAYKVNGKYMVVKLDAKALGLGDTFDFKWADNSVDSGDIMQFIDLGDTAPNDRFNYRYTTTETKQILPETLTADMVVLKAGSYFAFVEGEMVRLDESTTKATFFGDDGHLYLPFEFAKSVNLASEGDKTYNHYGVAYVDVTAALERCGKTVTRSDDMLVLADKALTEDELLILYRALY